MRFTHLPDCDSLKPLRKNDAPRPCSCNARARAYAAIKKRKRIERSMRYSIGVPYRETHLELESRGCYRARRLKVDY